MTARTPGPWECECGGWPLIINAGAISNGVMETVATIPLPEGSTGDDATGAEAEANGRLIAAAPDMLAALEAISAMYPHNGIRDGGPGGIARLAIAKAVQP